VQKAWSITNLVEVDSEICNYESYKDLLLICPCCKGNVFLKKGYKKKNGGIVKAHFSHFKRDKEYIECELRSKTKKGKEELNISLKKLRNQRKQFFIQNLWNIISYTDEDINIDYIKILKDINTTYSKPLYKKHFNRLPKKLRKMLRDSINKEEIFIEGLNRVLEKNIETVKIITLTNYKRYINQYLLFKFWKSKTPLLDKDFNKELHISTTKEVFLYLLELEEDKIWKNLIKISLKLNEQDIDIDTILLSPSSIFSFICCIISSVPWTYNINKMRELNLIRHSNISDKINEKIKIKGFSKT